MLNYKKKLIKKSLIYNQFPFFRYNFYSVSFIIYQAINQSNKKKSMSATLLTVLY